MTPTADIGNDDWPSDDPILPLQHPDEAPLVRTDEDVRRRWRSLMGKDGFGHTSLWVVWYDADGRQLPIVMPIDDLPELLDETLLDSLISIVADPVNVGAASVALAVSRPGSGTVTTTDRARVNAILAAVDRARRRLAFGLKLWPVHLATVNSVRPMTVDDLG